MAQKEDSEYLDMEAEETFFSHCSKTSEDDEFDLIVQNLETILFDDDFMAEQNSYFENHCKIFEDSPENKLEYMEVFNRYTRFMENIIEERMRSKLFGFSMNRFEKMLSTRAGELAGEVFDTLSSMGDFSDFKETMLSFKNKGGKGQLDLTISGHHLK